MLIKSTASKLPTFKNRNEFWGNSVSYRIFQQVHYITKLQSNERRSEMTHYHTTSFINSLCNTTIVYFNVLYRITNKETVNRVSVSVTDLCICNGSKGVNEKHIKSY